MNDAIKNIEDQLKYLRAMIDNINSIPNIADVSITTADGKVSIPVPDNIKGHICYQVMREYRYKFDELLHKYKKLRPTENKKYFLISIDEDSEIRIIPYTSEVEAKNAMHTVYNTCCFDKEELTGCGDCWIREFDAFVDNVNNGIRRRWVIVSEDDLYSINDVLVF